MRNDPRADKAGQTVESLRTLFSSHGYTPYRMSKFEEYDLYSRNKDFLISDNVLTFTDTDGRLMALKPDVTLSIVKNTDDIPERTRKIYYDERVYRVARGMGGFREIRQAGLECIGNVDECCAAEVLYLAAASLSLCGKSFILDVSNLGILTAFTALITEDSVLQEQLLQCASQKNLHGIRSLCSAQGLAGKEEALVGLLEACGPIDEALPKVKALCERFGALKKVEGLSRILTVFEGSPFKASVRLDFSAVSDTRYYNGLAFRGFVEGIPDSVLSGGQYDHLMRRMHKRSRAIGFAVYLDLLSRLYTMPDTPDVDVLLICDENTTPAQMRTAADALRADGSSVLTAPGEAGVTAARTLYLINGEVREKC